MVEKAFKVKHGSKFEKLYFQSKEERKAFNDAAVEFSEAHNIELSKYRQRSPLECSLTDEERKRFADQLCKDPGRSGRSYRGNHSSGGRHLQTGGNIYRRK